MRTPPRTHTCNFCPRVFSGVKSFDRPENYRNFSINHCMVNRIVKHCGKIIWFMSLH